MYYFYPLFLFLSVLSFLFFSFFKIRRATHMFQQNGYYFSRYFRWIRRHVNETLLWREIFFTLIAVGLMYYYEDVTKQLMIFSGLQLVLAFTYKRGKSKKPLVYTSRIKRLFVTMFILLIALAYFGLNSEAINEISLLKYYGVLILGEALIFIVLIVAALINYPIERLVYYRYFYSAKHRLKKHKRLVKIGVTGSYGKTSSKNVIGTILDYRYSTLASPASYNTPMGLTRTIREFLKPTHDVFVAEMGAYQKGDIKVLANFIKPKYGVVTSIGPAHLESFGSMENILAGKFELIESLGKDGIAILNRDDEMQRSYVIKNPCKVMWYGIHEEADVMAKNITLSHSGTSFDLFIKRHPISYRVQTKLLGEHNVYNVLAGITIALEMGMEPHDLLNAIRYVKPVEHRLSMKKAGHITYIDDAFNSNPIGSKKALEVLDAMPGRKVIITPGMIELGEKQYELNKVFGRQIATVCDEVILVGEKQTVPIQDGLKEMGYDALTVVNDVKEAFELVANMEKTETFVLIENDLPDLFKES